MSGVLINLIIQIVAGAIGGNVAGGASKDLSLGTAGNTNDSAAMNVWLHKQVMIKLAENGGKVPDSLRV